MRHDKKLKILILITITFLFSTCNFFKNSNAVLWTNRPEFAVYTEIFNSSQEDYKIEIIYKESPAHSLLKENDHPDVIIDENLLSAKVSKKLKNMNFLIQNDNINPDIFYSELLALGKIEKKQIVLPISFNLPLIMLKSGSEISNKSIIIDIEKILDDGKLFNEKNNEKSTYMGFSPVWESEFLYITTLLFNSNFHEINDNKLSWNDSNLNSTLSFIRNWIKDVNGGFENDKAFSEKYLLNPPYKLIENDKILFAYSNIKTFVTTIPEEKRKQIEFRWIAKDNHIPILEDVLWGGFPKKGTNTEAASVFLKWFFDFKTQELLLKTIREKRIRTFGIGQGLSSIIKINETIFPKAYQFLLGYIPTPDLLSTQKPLPLNWKSIKKEVLIPWLLKESSKENTSINFSSRLDNWSLLEPDL